MLQIRPLCDADPPVLSAAFAEAGSVKPAATFERYLSDQRAGTRACLVATLDAQLAGYVTLNWTPHYPALAAAGIPEIQDLNVLPAFRRRGIATRLLDRAEALAGARSDFVGIAVGLHPGYNAAQCLYVRRGYIPDGSGVTYRNRYVPEGAQVVLDDDLLLHLTLRVRP